MDVQLWRWSTAVQITSALLIALFFVVLTRSTHRTELRIWVVAWLANVLALIATLLYWVPVVQSEALMLVLRYPFVFFKMTFVALLITGAVGFERAQPSRQALWRIAQVLLVCSIVAAYWVSSIDMMGVLVPSIIAVGLGAAAVYLIVSRAMSCGWLAAGFALRAVLALLEAAAHYTRLTRGEEVLGGTLNTFVAMSSAFDAGAEWLIALGGVLALYDRIGRDLTRINADLSVAESELRSQSQRDPLTGVFNRRRLADILRDCRQTGATILFFDLDDFKEVNDLHGHHVGDEVLRQFAGLLQSAFRPGDHVIRYAGDEFIVVGQGIDQVDVAARITALRETLRREAGACPRITFTVGEAQLPVGGDPDAAIRAADAAMYRRKGIERRPA